MTHFFKRMLVMFWATWMTLAMSADIGDLLVYFQVGGYNGPFTSKNLNEVFEMLRPFSFSSPIIVFLFFCIIFWAAMTAFLLWRAVFTKDKILWRSRAILGYIAIISLGLVFGIADELFIFYKFEDGLMARLCCQILSLMSIWIIPDRLDTSPTGQ